MRQDNKSLPFGWFEQVDRNGQPIYRNLVTEEDSVTFPVMPAEYFWIKRLDEVECYHLLVKHVDSEDPTSGRDGSKITRTRAEAKELIKKYRKMIKYKRKTFQQLARVVSDCPTVCYNGHLRIPVHGQMQRQFNVLIGEIDVGTLSDIFESPAGFHLLMRRR